jgi:hypothetical protein
MKTLVCFTLLILLEISKVFGAAHGVIVPPDPSPGNSSLAAPFLTSTSSRLQQVYGRDGFPPIQPTSGFLIEGIYFRVDESSSRGFDEIFPSVQVNLSTTSRGPDGLSTLFSENIGLDETTSFGPGPLHLSGFQPGFTVGFMFDRPYFYNPAAGNLLLDVRNYGPGNASILDAFASFGDSVSIVGNENVNSPIGDIFTHGLATEFWVDIVPIPEPSTSVLLLFGLLALGWKLFKIGWVSRSVPRPISR